MEKEILLNNKIRFAQVLCIDENGVQLGAMSSKDAYFKAKDKGLDLYCVAPNAPIPVCKILDYSKFRFEQQKKEKELKKKQKENRIETSEIQLSMVIQMNDLQTKAKTCKRLIEKGDLVRVVLRLRSREIDKQDLAIEKLKSFIELCSDFASIKKEIFLEGRDLKLILEKKK